MCFYFKTWFSTDITFKLVAANTKPCASLALTSANPTSERNGGTGKQKELQIQFPIHLFM
jgi:hypothetical protein